MVEVVHFEMYRQLNEKAPKLRFPSLVGEGTEAGSDTLDSTLVKSFGSSDSVESCKTD